MPVEVTVLYPNEEDADFKLDYYLSSHMPMVAEKFKPHGLLGWNVLKFVASGDGSKPLYSIQATLKFNSTDEVSKAFEAESGPVLGDIPNFSNKNPVLIIGNVEGSWSG